jgi:aldehyde dehydrogenase (NAD+)
MSDRPDLVEGRTLFVDGSWRAGRGSYARFDPARLPQPTGTFATGSAADVLDAYEAAVRAQPEWGATPAPRRGEVLRRAADLLEEREAGAARRLTEDMGKAIRDAHAEVRRSVAILRYYAGEVHQASGETYPSADPTTTLFTIERPLGVVCAITPWNFPFAIPTWKLAPALAFGNAVLWKPAAAASGSAVLLTEVLVQAGVPAGVLNLITGSGGALSEALTGDERLSGLTFTGSGAVGTGLRRAVADRNVKVQLELGGKNPAIVLGDADLEHAATEIVRGAMLATGQRCTATSRLYVERPVAERLLPLLVDRVERLVVGDPYEEATEVGPLASEQQRDTVAEYLSVAAREGARVLVGGSALEGLFVEPTIVCDVAASSRLMREEIFGPVLAVAEVGSFEEAVAAANETEFGLSSAIFTRDLGRALEFARETESGLVHINRETGGAEPHVPFGGVKASSSMAREMGTAARAFFTTTKTVYLRTP